MSFNLQCSYTVIYDACYLVKENIYHININVVFIYLLYM